jgi:signal transduction histidine kinase
MHKLLERQLRKHFAEKLDAVMVDERFQKFCQSVDQAYSAHDDDRELLERSLELSSRELNEKNHDLQRAQYLAETANKAKSTFLANMSHEMRTPLNAIIGYSELILEEIEELSHEEISVELDKIRTSGNHLLGLINNVLDLAKIESGHMEVNWETVELGILGKEICTILQPIALKNRNRLVCEIETHLPVAVTDRSKLKQILINLVGNALKFTHDGRVTIRIADAEGDRIKVAVTDSGIGMSPDKLVKLFQPFVQAESDIQKRFGGTGLGLSISKKFSDLIESELEVQSQEGVGTSFHLLLHLKLHQSVIRTLTVAF